MKKKALAVLSSSKTLCDFFWYYIEYGSMYEWDVLIHKAFILSDGWLEKSGIFHHIYTYDTDLTKESPFVLIAQFVKMFTYMAVNKREAFAENSLKKLTDNNVYDLYVVVPCSKMLLPGFVYLMGENHEVVILEDGTADYVHRPNKWVKTNSLNLYYISGFLLAKMGYGDLTFQYIMKSWRNCVKCATYPEKLEYTDYKEILKIGCFTGDNYRKYEELVRKVFDLGRIEDIDIVLYTVPLSDFTDDIEVLLHKTEQYINENYSCKNLLLKRHPRDRADYHFNHGGKVTEANPAIPGELIEEYLGKHKDHTSIFMYASSMIRNLRTEDYVVLYYDELDNPSSKLAYAITFNSVTEKWSIPKDKTVRIE